MVVMLACIPPPRLSLARLIWLTWTGSRPDRNEHRVGEQYRYAYIRSKTTPLATSAFIVGVTSSLPGLKTDGASLHPQSSTNTWMMCGRALVGDGGGGGGGREDNEVAAITIESIITRKSPSQGDIVSATLRVEILTVIMKSSFSHHGDYPVAGGASNVRGGVGHDDRRRRRLPVARGRRRNLGSVEITADGVCWSRP